MAIVSGITFGDVKADLATVVGNGQCADDPRVLPATNEATKVLLDHLIPVNGMAIYDVTADGTILLLPKELENAIEVEVLGAAKVNNQSDIKHGVYDIVSNFTYIDPSTAHDLPLDDLGLERDPDDHSILRRKYDFPGLDANSVVRVTGAKRYIPLLADGDSLIIQNIPALKLAILSREYVYRGASYADDAQKYLQMAISQLEAEVKKHLMDPRRALKKKAAYQADIATYAEGTLGRTRARLALEVPGFLLKGKAEITYLVNRAVQMLVDSRNQLAIAGRISVHGSTAELAYTPANFATSQLIWGDYNQIRLMVQSFITEGPDPNAVTVAEEFQKKAFELQKAQLVEATEKARHSTYTQALSTYISGTFGWTVARLALEMPGGLALTTVELERLVSMSEMRLIERGLFKGTLKTVSATIRGGELLFPRDVEAMLAADIDGQPCDIRSILFEYQKNGPGKFWDVPSAVLESIFHLNCGARFVDEGEVYFPQTGARRRKYRYRGSASQDVQLNAVCKIRWQQRESCDEMVIKNFEAIRLFSQGIQNERNEKWPEARTAQLDAIEVLEKETQQYLGGIKHVQESDTDFYGFAGLGHPL